MLLENNVEDRFQVPKGLFTFYRQQQQYQKQLKQLEKQVNLKDNKCKKKRSKNKNKNKIKSSLKISNECYQQNKEKGRLKTDISSEYYHNKDLKQQFLRMITNHRHNTSNILQKNVDPKRKNGIIYTDHIKKVSQQKNQSQQLNKQNISSSVVVTQKYDKNIQKLQIVPQNISKSEKSIQLQNRVCHNFYCYSKKIRNLEEGEDVKCRIQTQENQLQNKKYKVSSQKQLVKLPLIQNINLNKGLVSQNVQKQQKNRYNSKKPIKISPSKSKGIKISLNIDNIDSNSHNKVSHVDFSKQQKGQSGHDWKFRKKNFMKKLGIQKNI